MTGTVLVTGPGGFVGRATVPVLEAAGWQVRRAGRAETGDMDGTTDWAPHLAGCEAVVHLAARVHVMRETGPAAETAARYRDANAAAAIRLGEQARAAGVARFVFMSSVKVHGDSAETPLTGASPTAPVEPYAVAKAEAERALLAMGGTAPGAMAVTVLRPPLVYGPGVRGNFLALIAALERGWPLPLAAIDNRRSLIYAGNLADAIRAALEAPAGIYLPGDGAPVSTPALVRALAAALGRPARLLPVPPAVLELAGRVTGKSASVQRLLGSLVVDGKVPGWRPPVTFEAGLRAVAAWRRDARATAGAR